MEQTNAAEANVTNHFFDENTMELEDGDVVISTTITLRKAEYD